MEKERKVERRTLGVGQGIRAKRASVFLSFLVSLERLTQAR